MAQWGPSHHGEALAAHPHWNTASDVNRPRFLQDGQDGTEVLRPALTRRGRHDGRGPPGTAKTLSPADIYRPWPISTVPGRHQVFRCSIWLDMRDPTVMDRVDCI